MKDWYVGNILITRSCISGTEADDGTVGQTAAHGGERTHLQTGTAAEWGGRKT